MSQSGEKEELNKFNFLGHVELAVPMGRANVENITGERLWLEIQIWELSALRTSVKLWDEVSSKRESVERKD